MTYVLTNDDGIDAPGMQALRRATQRLALNSIVVAPIAPHSGCGHQVTTRMPIAVQQRSPTDYAIGGTPVDCVRLAITHLCPDLQWVLSGINWGGNLGADVYISGTVAAVREAALHRIPAIAISHYCQRQRSIDWQRATDLTVQVLQELLDRPLVPGNFWNVNLPHLAADAPQPKIVFCPPCTQPLPAEYRVEGDQFYYVGEYAQRCRDRDGDVAVCFSGHIAVTQLSIATPTNANLPG